MLQQRKEVTLRSDAEERVHVRHDGRSSWLMLSGGCTRLCCILYILRMIIVHDENSVPKKPVYCNDFGGDRWIVASA